MSSASRLHYLTLLTLKRVVCMRQSRHREVASSGHRFGHFIERKGQKIKINKQEKGWGGTTKPKTTCRELTIQARQVRAVGTVPAVHAGEIRRLLGTDGASLGITFIS
eukprot:TRINITY_DN5155_c0_g3_i2.p1 TRINITY_DN5155_c0_g3~~TRINITY_DN5155_c0_g3_i2.p1  ORF type:complete len:108 (-),score=5.24 TRINITY_DN5155_c0_g3_i2:164-487(-)